MKIANLDGRLTLLVQDGVVDVATASDGRFGPNPMDAYQQWSAFSEWASTVTEPTGQLDRNLLKSPVPSPAQVFAIGLNYRAHAQESGMDLPKVPATFTKYPASLSGPFDDIEIVGDAVDWEAELVVVIGARADRVEEANAWEHVAGLTVGQDVSDRALQFAAGMQFSLGKSRRGYGPMGPWLVTPDEVADPDNLSIGCRVDGETVQDARTDDLVFPIATLIAELSAVLPLLPGDVIFTGTPSGVGMARKPPRSLQPGMVLETWVEGIGEIRNVCVAQQDTTSPS